MEKCRTLAYQAKPDGNDGKKAFLSIRSLVTVNDTIKVRGSSPS
jgi:hypothetical protein